MSNDTIFYTQIASVLAFIGSLFVLYRVLVQQKDATIELLKKQTEWLDQQLKTAKENSPDALLERLSKRISILDAELSRLSEDSATSEKTIKDKERELQEARILMCEVAKELGVRAGEFADLRTKVDLCDYCEAPLAELKNVHDGDWTGSHRKYTCGYTILEGERIYFCPSDPDYPNFDEEFEVEYQGRILADGWTCYFVPKTEKAKMVEQITAFGISQESALQNLKEEYYRNPSK